jgi:hypothetical protein
MELNRCRESFRSPRTSFGYIPPNTKISRKRNASAVTVASMYGKRRTASRSIVAGGQGADSAG